MPRSKSSNFNTDITQQITSMLVYREEQPSNTVKNSTLFISLQFPFNNQNVNHRSRLQLNFAKYMTRINAEAYQRSEAFHQTARVRPKQKLRHFKLIRTLICINHPNYRNIANIQQIISPNNSMTCTAQ